MLKEIGLLKLLRHLSVFAIWGSLFIGFYGVICRNLLGTYPAFAEEVPRYLIVWVVFLAMPEVFCLKLNIGINWLTKKMKRYRMVLIVFQEVVVAFSSIILFWSCLSLTMHQFNLKIVSATTLAVPMYFVTVAIPIGSAILFIYVVKSIVRKLSRTPDRADIEAAPVA